MDVDMEGFQNASSVFFLILSQIFFRHFLITLILFPINCLVFLWMENARGRI